MKIIIALYDEENIPLGSFDRYQLRDLLKTTNHVINCIISRIKKKKQDSINYEGKRYKAYLYKADY